VTRTEEKVGDIITIRMDHEGQLTVTYIYSATLRSFAMASDILPRNQFLHAREQGEICRDSSMIGCGASIIRSMRVVARWLNENTHVLRDCEGKESE
jgi:hypothetical protein